MISSFNWLLNCFGTGLVTALFILLFTQLGWLPLVIFTEVAPKEEVK